MESMIPRRCFDSDACAGEAMEGIIHLENSHIGKIRPDSFGVIVREFPRSCGWGHLAGSYNTDREQPIEESTQQR